MATIEEGRFCKDDADCSEKQYCYDVSGRCVDFTNCSRYNRQEAHRSSRHPSQCGPCIRGYTAEILGTGETALMCNKNTGSEKGTEVTVTNDAVIWITVGAIVCFMLTLISGLLFKKKLTRNGKRDNKKWSDVCIAGPTAPPPEISPFIASGEQVSTPVLNNNKNLKDKNTLVSATPFKEPYWIRSNPNYEHHISDENLSAPGHSQSQAQQEENTGPSTWTPEQLAIQVPVRSLTELGTEHRDNAVNSILVQGTYSPSTSTTENNNNAGSTSSETNETEDNRDRVRTSNVLITQKITMNLNLLNGDC